MPNNSYTNVVIDVYFADPEGIATGQTTDVPEFTNGFVQGKTYVSSFVVDGPVDLNAQPGVFEFEVGSLGLSTNLVTITANYSAAPAGTHNAVVITSPFSDPVGPASGGAPITITNVRREGGSLVLSWSGGTGPYTVQMKTQLTDPTWTDAATTPNTTATVPIAGTTAFLRIVGR